MKCVLLAAFTVALFSTSSLAQEFTVDKDAAAYNAPDYSPFVDQHYPNRVFWGDTHLHTSNSPDAGLVANSIGATQVHSA